MEKRIYIEMNGKWKQTFFGRDYNDFLGIKRRILIQMSVINVCKIVHIHKLKLQPCRMKIVEEAPLIDFVNLNHKEYRIYNILFPTFCKSTILQYVLL